MPITLILNQNNIVENSGNSSFLYNFPQGGYQFKDQFIAVQQISMYNSVFNISSANNNNKFSYIWVDGTTVNITLPDSYLSVSEINAYMQSVMVDNTHFLISGTSYVYLLEIVVNPSRYADQINSYVISSTIATNNTWTLPPSATWVLPTNAICPMFVVPSTNFQQLIGYTAGNYPNSVIAGTPPAQTQTPSYTSTQSFLSSTAPQIVPQPYYLCICTLVNNRLAIPSQLLFSLTPTGSGFGELYTIQMSELAFNKIEDGHYTQFIFRFVDSFGSQITLQDPNTNILLVIKTKAEMSMT